VASVLNTIVGALLKMAYTVVMTVLNVITSENVLKALVAIGIIYAAYRFFRRKAPGL